MTVSKAARAQRKLRKAENAQKAQKSSLDTSDSESNIITTTNLAEPPSNSPTNTVWSLPEGFLDQDAVVNPNTDKEDDDNNKIIHTIEQNLLDSDDEDACNQGVVNPNLWPVFLQRNESKPSVGKRINKYDIVMKGYKNPIQHINKNNSKLMSRPNAQQTKSYRNKKMKLGSQNVGLLTMKKNNF